MRHLLDIDDISALELADILDLAEQRDPHAVLGGLGVALIFEKPSNRTRNSSEMAVVDLGGHPISIRGEEIGLGLRETVEDVTLVLAQYHAAVGARVNDHRVLQAMTAVDAVPIINLLSDVSHPCQAIADVLTLRQHWGSLDGRTVAWIGDGNNVARSLAFACALTGMEIRLACPAGHQLDAVDLDAVRALGGQIIQTTDPAEAAAGADAVCTDVWVSMGQEGETATRVDAFAGYQVDSGLMAGAAAGAVFLHCLPAHRGLEVAAEVIDGPASLVFPQAGNRRHAMRGLLLWLQGERP